MFVTQRGFLYAVPVGLALLTSWRAKWFCCGEDAARSMLPFWLEVLFYSTLPLFHLHTFLFLSVLLGIWLISATNNVRVQITKLLGASAIQVVLFVSLVTGLFQNGTQPVTHLIHLKAGWMQDDQGFWIFWFRNFGLLPLFVLAIPTRAFFLGPNNPQARSAAAFTIPSILLFMMTCFVMFAPWEWDNTKLMIWCYLSVLPFLWEVIIAPLPIGLVVTSCVLLFFSGFISLWGGLNRSHVGYPIAQASSELAAIQRAVAGISGDETYAAMPTYNHPLLLCGCKVAVGYPPHLMSHGISYEERDAQLRKLMLGAPDWRDIAHDLHIHYIFWGQREISGRDGEAGYRSSLTPWRDDDDLVAEGDWGELYNLKNLAYLFQCCL